MDIINESEVPRKYSSYRIDKYLAERFTYQSRSRWQEDIKAGRLSLNGKIVYDSHKKICHGNIIRFRSSDITEPDVDKNFNILYEDDHIIGIDKPGNLPVHPSGRFFNNTLLSVMEKKLKRKFYPVHRLDRETSGVIMFSKTSETASLLHKNFHNFKKSYISIVHGIPGDSEFTVNMPIGNDRMSPVRKKRSAYPEAGESAVTHFKKLETSGKFSVLKAVPETGRLHQIRVHLNFAGFPILGDKLYGIDEMMYLEFIENGISDKLINTLEFPRSALHAMSLNFYHPALSRNITITSPIPADFAEYYSSS